jgi:hypothetical protein
MKTFVIIMCITLALLVSVKFIFGQTIPTYYHDTTLDGIQNNVGYVDSAVNSLSNTIPLNEEGWAVTNTQATQSYLATNRQYDPYNNTYSSVTVNGSTNQNAMTNLYGGLDNALIGQDFSNVIASQFSTNTVDGGTDTNFSLIFANETGTGYYGMSFTYLAGNFLPASLPNLVNAIILGLFWYIIFRAMIDDLHLRLDEVGKQRQLEGNKQEAFGANYSAFSAYGRAIYITVFLAIAVGIVLTSSFFGSIKSLAYLPTTSSEIISLAQSSGLYQQWHLLTTFLPVTQMLSGFIYYLSFRYLLIYPAFLVVQSIIYFMVA